LNAGYILNPNENHGLRDIVLRKVLREIFSLSKVGGRSIFDADIIDLSSVEIRREWRNIDLLIILDQDVIVIENKIDTADHSDQLRRYKTIVDGVFANKHKHYVYLTPFGSDPIDAPSREHYVNISYSQIADLIESILCLYGDSISSKVSFYLKDYLLTVRRELLMNDRLNELAVKVYHAHKEAFDFVFENKPDPASELYPNFETIITERRYVMGSKNKGYARFTTPKLNEILPHVGVGWPDKEIFLFEIDYYWSGKSATFKAAIAPGDESLRNKIISAVKNSKYYKDPQGKKWLVIYSKKFTFDVENIANEDDAERNKKISAIIDDAKPVIEEFTGLIERVL